ncbi:GNAT family N-acetyltransferase [Sphingomonas solaris]|uniref:GNAT family N-acetyltransferase n=1 Tax=Alterirhizorhabdus solaris TaxID=2529389 RepID=A0A558R4C3_9SPHN|nr:GNAT family N-acetyltransferase [Sphingomonas solaris]TVV74240.1 GNAT family N-acetyltransferase [Sphingomonas solaris]
MSGGTDDGRADSDLAITPALAGDIDPVMTVMADAFDPAFGEAWNAAQCLGILNLPGVWMLLARHGGQPAGFALARIVLDEAELLLIGVRPAFRRHGIGSALLDRVKQEAQARGGARLHLEVRDGNPALHLYHQRGFARTGCRPGYYRGADGRSFDALSLSTGLDPATA